MKKCLLLGRKAIIVDDVKDIIDTTDTTLFSGTSLQDVKDTFNSQDIDIVIMGAGIDINDRLDIIRYIFKTSKSTTVHMKDWNSGPAGMLPFVSGLLNG
jgi:predicted GTPase